MKKKLEALAESFGKKVQVTVQSQVSGNRTRFKDDAFDLDLTYVTPRLIAMGLPGEGVKSLVRNSAEDVAAFFQLHHPEHYRIWNLANQTYDYAKFENRVLDFGFPDQRTAPLEHLVKIVRSIDQWLEEDPRNVAAVHCLAGKGRTGCVCCAYLLYCGEKATPEEAIAFFLERRKQGVESPSQKRYLDYLHRILPAPRHAKLPVAHILRLSAIRVHGVPKLEPRFMSLSVQQYESEDNEGATRATSRLLYTSSTLGARLVTQGDVLSVALDIVLEGDIVVQVFHTGLSMEVALLLGVSSAELARLNFHTALLPDTTAPIVFKKEDLDVAFRNPKLAPDFRIELLFEGHEANHQLPSPPTSGPPAASSSSSIDAATVAVNAVEPVDDGRACGVCFEAERSARLPCGHCTLCGVCVTRVQQLFGRCPVCDAPFTAWEGHDHQPDETYVRNVKTKAPP